MCGFGDIWERALVKREKKGWLNVFPILQLSKLPIRLSDSSMPVNICAWTVESSFGNVRSLACSMDSNSIRGSLDRVIPVTRSNVNIYCSPPFLSASENRASNGGWKSRDMESIPSFDLESIASCMGLLITERVQGARIVK